MYRGGFFMEEHIFEGIFQSDEEILGLDDILLDQDFQYQSTKEGMHILGKIYITFVMKRLLRKDPGSLVIPVDLFVTLNEIDHLKEIALEIDHFTFDLEDKKVKFRIFTRLKGNHEDLIRFEPTPNKEINDEFVSLFMRQEEISPQPRINEDEISEMENILSSKDVELISTPFEKLEPEEDWIELKGEDTSASTRNEILQTIKETVEKIKENIIKSADKGEIVKNISEDSIPISAGEEKKYMIEKKEEKKEELFKETYQSNAFFYRIRKEENLHQIAARFKKEEEELKKINPQKKFQEGELIKIPK